MMFLSYPLSRKSLTSFWDCSFVPAMLSFDRPKASSGFYKNNSKLLMFYGDFRRFSLKCG